MSALLYALICISLFSSLAQAEASNCLSIKSVEGLYECIVKNHPEIKSAELSVEAAKSANDKITQLPNPEVSISSMQGKNSGENEGSTELSLSINLTETLLKRAPLSKLGRAEEKVLIVDAQESVFRAKSQALKNLYRYRQVLDELELVTEALETFKKIENQFKARRVRGPEQSVTLNLVELAQGDYELQRNHLNAEKTKIETEFKGVFGENFILKKEWLPKLKKNWPPITGSELSKQTFEVRKFEAEKEKAEAEKSIAMAESMPKIAAGPSMQRTTTGTAQYMSYGLNLTVDLPIFSLNGGGRRLAEKNLTKSQYTFEYAMKKADLEKKLLLQIYSAAVESLKKSITIESLKKKHDQIDSLFRQGLTAGPTVIEAHRQISEFHKSQHEHEMEALESLMYLNVLSNKEIGEVLK